MGRTHVPKWRRLREFLFKPTPPAKDIPKCHEGDACAHSHAPYFSDLQ